MNMLKRNENMSSKRNMRIIDLGYAVRSIYIGNKCKMYNV